MTLHSALENLVWPSTPAKTETALPTLKAGTPMASLQWLARIACASVLVLTPIMSDDGAIWNSEVDGADKTTAAETSDALDADARPSDEPTREWIVGAYGGVPYTYPSSVTLSDGKANDFQIDGVEWRGEPFIDPIYYGIRIQRWFEGGRT
ncbi:MAG: hypothetical protein AAFO75_03190, partial [Pseudomonadota bacterium]